MSDVSTAQGAQQSNIPTDIHGDREPHPHEVSPGCAQNDYAAAMSARESLAASSSLQNALDALRKEVKMQADTINRLHQERDTLEALCERLRAENGEIREAVRPLEASFATARAELRRVKTQLKEQSNALRPLREENSTLAAKLQASQEHNEYLSSSLSKLETARLHQVRCVRRNVKILYGVRSKHENFMQQLVRHMAALWPWRTSTKAISYDC